MTYDLPDRDGEALEPRPIPNLLAPCPDGMARLLAKEFAPDGIHRLEQYANCPDHPAWRTPDA